MDEKHEVSGWALYCMKFYGICLILAVVLYFYTHKAEMKAYDAGLHAGKSRYWDSIETAALRKRAADVVEKVEKANGNL